MSVRRRLFGPPVTKLPTGLLELMDGLARDVLKNNPENIYEFCAHHMHTLLEIRDGRAIKPLLTLEEKIERAQKKVKERAEQRQREYNKNITEDTNKLTVETELSAAVADSSGVSDNSKDSKTEISSIGAQAEVKEEIMIIEQKVLDNSAEFTSALNNESNDKTDTLNKVDNEELDEKDNVNKSAQEIITVIESDENEHNTLLIDSKSETGEDIHDDDSSDINIIIEGTASVENQSVVSISDITKVVNDDIDDSLPDEVVIKLECDDNTEEKDGNVLHNAKTEPIQNEGGTESKTDVETLKKDTSDEVKSTDTIVKVVSPSGDIQEDNNSDSGIDTEQIAKQIDPIPQLVNNAVNNNGVLTILPNTETEDNMPEQRADVNEPEKSQDDEILNVILDGNESQSAAVENKEMNGDIVKHNGANPIVVTETTSIPKDSDQQTEQNIDIERVPESSNDNDKTNNSSMDLETAAITIQKVFRSFLFKTKTASYDDSTTVDITLLAEDKEKEESEVLNIKDRRPLGLSRMDTVLQTVNEEKSLSLSTDDSSTLSSAATIIQAHVRGFLVRNKLNSNKTISSNSLLDSDAPSIPSLEADSDNVKNKTILNIHIVPEGGHFVSRDESILNSMDLSLDSSPPSSVNLHPLGYDKSERRKQLKREDAIQSVSPPSNNSGKLSEDHDSVKEVLTESNTGMEHEKLNEKTSVEENDALTKREDDIRTENSITELTEVASDEMDVVTPFVEGRSSRESDSTTKLLHSGEFHDIVVPTNVSRSDTSVVRGE